MKRDRAGTGSRIRVSGGAPRALVPRISRRPRGLSNEKNISILERAIALGAAGNGTVVKAWEIALKYNTGWTWDISNFVIKS